MSNSDLTIAFDPGITTGVAVLDRDGSIRTWQLKSDYKALSLFDIRRLLIEYGPDAVVTESFTYQRRQKVELFPVEVIGVIRQFCEEYTVRLYEQSPAQAKKLWTDDKIKKISLWSEGLNHGMDALRHLLYHRTVTKKDMTYVERLRPDGR